jgi:hypothetical protein
MPQEKTLRLGTSVFHKPVHIFFGFQALCYGGDFKV